MSSSAIESKSNDTAEPMRTRKRRTVLSSDAIVAIAMDLFEKQGFDQTTVDEIADAAGVSKRTIFRHFETKTTVVLHPIKGAFWTLPDMLAATPKALAIDKAIGLALKTLAQAMDSERATVVRHTRLIATSPELRAAARSYTDAAMQNIRREIAVRTGEAQHSVRATVWAELMLLAAFCGRDRWLSSPKVSIEAVIDDSLREIAAFTDLFREANAPNN